MTHLLARLCLLSSLAAALGAQSPLTTIFGGGSNLGPGSSMYFDLVLNVPLTFQAIDFLSSSAPGTPGSLHVRWCANSYVGNDGNAAAWTLASSGTATAGGGLTHVALPPFTLPPGSYGFNLEYVGFGQEYTVVAGGVGPIYATNEATLIAGASSMGPPGAGICCDPRLFNGQIHYTVPSSVVAQATPFGFGCYKRAGSFYEFFPFPTPSLFDLANRSVSMLRNGAGYVVAPGNLPFVPPSATATALPLGDDTEITVPLTSPFPHATGTTTSLTVCSNGFVSIAPGNGTSYIPNQGQMLAAPQTGFWAWHDYDTTAAGSGPILYDTVGSLAIFTWFGVYDYGGTSAADANHFQFQFDTATGAVHIVHTAMSPGGNERLVGYSPGGASIDPGNVDLSAALPGSLLVAAVESGELQLTASARPRIGTTIALDTSNVTGTSVGIQFLGTVALPAPGFSLAPLGAPGCPALVDLNTSIGRTIGNLVPGGLSAPLGIPNHWSLLGATLYGQSAWLDASANALGVLTSNGVALVVGNL